MAHLGSPDSSWGNPPFGGSRVVGRVTRVGVGSLPGPEKRGGVAMKLVKRLALAVGSLLALVLAGAAHVKL